MMNNVLPLESTSNNRFDNITVSALTEAEQTQLINLALEALVRLHQPGYVFKDSELTCSYLRLNLEHEKNEVFGVLFLDGRHRLIANEVLFTGTIDGASVYPRVVVQKTLEHNAAALIFYHNHPSGNPEASQADIQITERLKKALALVDIRVLDHFIVGNEGSVSFTARGLI
jgi:DNA repair protein RadC